MRVADIKFPLLYRPKSFSLSIVSEALDFLSSRYLNKALCDLTRVSTEVSELKLVHIFLNKISLSKEIGAI
jgi:hypothetical protein